MKTNIAGRAGRWSALHPWTAIALWLAFVAVAVALGRSVEMQKLDDIEIGSGESLRGAHVMNQNFTREATETVLVTSTRYDATSPPFAAVVTDLLGRLDRTGLVDSVQSPQHYGGENLISKDGHSALVMFNIKGDPTTAGDRMDPVVNAVAAAGRDNADITVEEAGDASINRAVNRTVMKDFRRAETLSFPITLIVLMVAFGAVVAAVVPVALAGTAIVAASALLTLVSRLTPVHATASSVMLLIGLAVGVDYSLFYIRREREERARGGSPQAALRAAAATSGRSVLISGLTVLVAMSGMYFAGSKIFIGFAEGTMLVVATSVVGSLTVLPALLSLLGDRIDKGRIPFLAKRASSTGESRAWWAVLHRTLKRPWLSALLSTAVLLALAIPALGIRTATPDVTDLPQGLPEVQIYNRIQQVFPGGPAPAIVVVTADNVKTPRVYDGIAALTTSALKTGTMFEPVTWHYSDNGRVVLVDIPLAGKGQDAASKAALAQLRTVVSSTIGRVPGVRTYITGSTAGTVDFNATMRTRFPLVVGFVLVLAFLLLLLSFRSVVVAATAIVLNLLSVGAAYGVLVGIFQNHWAEGILGFTSNGHIASWLPLFLFVVLFGLSMDYHVFILSRIREGHDRGRSTRSAVSHGIASTAGVVTAAAVVMVFVFLTFATLTMNSLKEMGVGLATAVLLDATVVRGVLLPSVMTMLGPRNWYLPRWLEWLPQATVGEGLATVPGQREPEETRDLVRH